MRLAPKPFLTAILLIVLLAGGVGLRLYVAARAVPFHDDFGTAALMSKHILEGRDYPLYFYGYRYMGALAAYVGAATFWLFGQSFFSLCLAMVPFSTLWILATFLLFRRLINAWAGLIAAAVVAFPPVVLVEYSTVPLLGYPTMLGLGTLLLYVGVRLTDPDLTPRAEWFCLFGMAVLAALAIWTNPISLPYLVVAFGLLVAHVVRSRLNRRLIVKLGVALVVFIVALLPVIVTVHTHGLRSMFGHWPASPRFIPRSIPPFVMRFIPNQLVGVEQMPSVAVWLVWLSYGVLGAGFVAGAIVAAVKRDRAVLRAVVVPAVFVLVFLLLFLSNYATPGCLWRYFTPFYLGVVACVVFPFAYGRRWLAAAATLVAALLVAFNVAATFAFAHGARARQAAADSAAIGELVAAAKARGLHHVMIPNYNGQTMTFVAGEQVVFCRTTKERYYPHTIDAAADDRAGFAKPDRAAQGFATTLRSLGITQFDSFSAGGWTVFYDIMLPDDRLRLIEPVAAAIVEKDGQETDAAGLIDRCDETIPGRPFEADASVVVDFGALVEIGAVRFVAPDEEDYPIAFAILGKDDSEWRVLQRVEERDALTCITGNRLDHWGHFTTMECRFEPARLRYLKVTGFQSASPGFKVWRFQEMYFYARDGRGGLPDDGEARAIARELQRLGASLVVADEWLSRKIELMNAPHPRVWPRWEFRFPSTHFARIVPIERGTALVVETAHADTVAARLADAMLGDVALARHDFAHYTAFIVENAPAEYAAFPGLRWNGLTVVDTARIASADWYYRHGAQIERAGNAEKALAYYRRSYETFPGIRANLERLADEDEAARATLESLTPAHEARVHFPHDVSLIGYTLAPSTLVPGQPATLRLVWQLDGQMRHSFMPIFVHFRSEKKRLFQADHNAVFPVVPGASVPPALVLDEFTFVVPDEVPTGELTIHVGATGVADRSVRLKPRTKLPTASRAVEIGRVDVGRH